MDKDLKRDFIVHRMIVGGMIIFILVVAAMALGLVMQKNQKKTAYDQGAESEVGTKKPLPDYMIEKIEKDELELLKP